MKYSQKIKKRKIPRIKKKTTFPRVIEELEGWNSQKQLSGPVVQKNKEKTLVLVFLIYITFKK